MDLEDLVGTQLFLALTSGATAPTVESRYEVRALLGRGAGGLVCRALDRRLDREVALKVMLADPGATVRVEREAKALAAVDHENIVPIYDYGSSTLRAGGENTPCFFISMKLIPGSSARVWRERASPSADEILRVYKSAALGLCAAHGGGVAHGDFKPENVMVDDEGAVRVVDFGLARQGSHGFTTEIEGTPAYMAPEVRRGNGGTASADQYALAAALWEALCEELPFGLNGEDAQPWRGVELIPEPVMPVLRRALSPMPNDRYPGMREFSEALEAAPPSRPTQRIPKQWGILALILAGLAAIAAAGGPELTRSPSTRRAAPGTAECSNAEGTWRYSSLVDDDRDSHYRGVRGYYVVKLTQLSGCHFDVCILKEGDDGQRHYQRPLCGSGIATASSVDGGGIRIETDLTLARGATRRGYQFVYGVRGEALSGRFERRDYGGDVILSGSLSGARAPDAPLGECANACL